MALSSAGTSMNRRNSLKLLGASGAGLAWPALAQAKPIRLIVPYPPGGPLDTVARALADKVKDSLGVVIVEHLHDRHRHQFRRSHLELLFLLDHAALLYDPHEARQVHAAKATLRGTIAEDQVTKR